MFPAAIEYLAGPVVIHPNEYYAEGRAEGQNEKPVGSGPYRVTNHVLGKSITLERNPDYFKDSPKGAAEDRQKIEIRFIPDRQTQMAEVLSGGMDFIMHVPKDQADQVKAVPNLQVVSGETMRIVFLQMNAQESSPVPHAEGPYASARRINHAIDREAMVKNLVGEGLARHPHDLLPVAVRLHRRGRAALRVRSREGEAAAGRGRLSERLRHCRSTPIASATRPRR